MESTQSLKARLQASTVAAMRAQDKARLSVLRLVQSAIKQQEIDSRTDATASGSESSALSDTQVLEVLDKMIRQRRDSVQQFAAAKREDLVQKESYEISVIQEFMPAPLTETEVRALIAESIKKVEARSIRDMSKVMALLKPQIQGRADMAQVGSWIKDQLATQ